MNYTAAKKESQEKTALTGDEDRTTFIVDWTFHLVANSPHGVGNDTNLVKLVEESDTILQEQKTEKSERKWRSVSVDMIAVARPKTVIFRGVWNKTSNPKVTGYHAGTLNRGI